MMQRRSFFAALGAPALMPQSVSAQTAASARGLAPQKIASVEFFRVDGRRKALAGVNNQYQVQPLHVYDEYRPRPYKDSDSPQERETAASAIYLSIKTSDGLEGLYGPIDREAASVADQQLRRFLVGKDALAGERLWDQLYRSDRHSRRGHYMMAISAIDNALWDLRGRFFNAPVYRLLGGPTREYVEAYGSALGYSVEPQAAAKRSAQLKEQGYRHQKWFLAYGPGDGAEGLEKNVELVKAVRQSVGDNVDLMFDAYSGWNLDYALAWAKRVEQYNPRWIEEAFHPEKIESFVELRKKTSIPVASGEHFYGRWEVHDYLKAGAISVVQADPEWCGGVSELVKICAVSSLFDAQVIPHGHGIHASVHVVASQSPMTCPWIEYLINKMSSYHHFEKHDYQVVNGRVALPERPGFGIELDPTKVEKRTVVKWT
jgi:L-alanine-DL-glutamate epimerase-like enolase superfamily enzyme